ncbi:MAG: 3-isopropylmalate dehydratase large subunit [Candidatus Hadarchaeota archaeon]
MGMTIAEKILAKKSDNDRVEPGEVVQAKIDRAMANDITAPLTIDALREAGFDKVWNPEKITLVIDHQSPPSTIEAAEDQKEIREFAEEKEISNMYGNFEGVCHQIMVEKAHVLPGELVVGADSHTCSYGAVGAFSTGIGSTDMAAVFIQGELWFKVPESIKITIENELGEEVMPKDLILKIAGDVGTKGAIYKALEFGGDGIGEISIPGRLSMCNMGVEMGAKTAIVPPDRKTENYFADKTEKRYTPILPDDNADYERELSYDAGETEPMVACPHNVDNVKPVRSLEDTEIHQAFLGSCTNGRLEDLRAAAEIIEGREIDDKVRMLVAPASKEIYRQAMDEGIIKILNNAGATIEPTGCTTCWGGHLGLLAPGETCISSSNRNFKGRMGSPEAEVYLASPKTVAASALKGRITDPRDL